MSLRVLIIGGGTAGWMTAAALSALLPASRARIQLVESEEIGTVGVGEATVPHIRFFNSRLGIDEADFMTRTRATFKLGIEFVNWSQPGDSYIHPFGAFGQDEEGLAFHQLWLRARNERMADDIQNYSLPILAARQDKFDFPASDPASALSTYSYAYQFDASLYAAFLREHSEDNGVERFEGRVTKVNQAADSGFVQSVTLDDGRILEGDLFIDCSGFRGLLIEQALASGYEDWSHWLPCDRAWAVPCEARDSITPYTRATAQQCGWTWRIPLQHRVGNGHVYSSSHCSDDEALSLLLKTIESEPLSEPRLLRFRAGRRRQQWSKNVVSIGLASGFLEPLESTSIHLIQLAIGYLVDLFPKQEIRPASVIEFNRIMAIEYERIRDFLILHYHATQREDSPFWNQCRNLAIPDSLAYRMELFRERGLVPNYRDGMFLDASWLAVYLGQKVHPRAWDPACDKLESSKLVALMERTRSRLNHAAESMPDHHAMLQKMRSMT